MYKTTADKQHDLARTGSHATKPLGTGEVKVLPPSADPWAAIFNDLSAHRRIIIENLDSVKRQLQDLNYALRLSSDPDEQRRWLLKRNALAAREQSINGQLTALREEIWLAARSSMGERFRVAAKAMLLDEQYAVIMEAAKSVDNDAEIIKWDQKASPHLMHRGRPAVKALMVKGKSPEVIQAHRDRERQRSKLKNLRRKRLY